MRAAPQSATVRGIVVVIGALLVGLGAWAFLDPAGFYAAVAVFPPYNQHFLHDVGAFQVGLGATMLLTQLWGDALLVAIAGTSLGATVHFVSHVVDRSLGGHPATDLPLLGALAAALAAGAWIRYNELRAAA